MKPIIGIVGRPNWPDEKTPSIVVMEHYRKYVIKHGGIPILILPPKLIDYNISKPSENAELTEEDKEILDRQLNLCNGILMPGGYKTFSHDFYILEYAIKKDIPILGICLGMQIMSNYQQEFFNEPNKEEGINHFDMENKYCHDVELNENSKLYSIMQKKTFKVNSLHKFHATKGGIYNIVGYSEDNLIEALELPTSTFNIGVQWHPERLDDEESNRLIDSFIEYSKKRSEK